MLAFVLLLVAIMGDIVATTSLKLSQGLTRPLPIVFVVLGYATAFYLGARCIQVLPLSVYYTVWTGLGTAGTVLVGTQLLHEKLTSYHWIGIGLILIGVMLLILSQAQVTQK